ncbi:MULTISPECIES: aldehyde dehydrogenase family protein [unclassified Beijerinckia]|uniref:aldehyde dehydrogenase family protein n=1 Tax=unclassified Beijerinckia TaxID=2638183 RepID=UPI000896FF49|nr:MULTISPECIES: aldehyde dehydrogenase family protein [unclassified Beijerinckia]MDH7794222.1 acyl-CoA reductase-like NAD-dependent aldehyde dehydrogenase [Beijerinckia sp. GAS462]SEB56165.1 Acyl-CoA reductase [Beijerinckia sp. 28-YEA-48]
MHSQSNTQAHIVEYLSINGRNVDGSDRIEVRNPARPDEVVGTIVRGTPDHVNEAVAAAKAAQPAWAALTFSQRASVLRRALARLESDIDRRAAVFVRENGKPLAQARAELLGVPQRQSMALDYAAQLDDERRYVAANGRTFVANRPYGVVVSIVPWNSPDSLAFTQIVAALLAGNCVVLKPPESCPLTLTQSVRMFAEELPAGAINIVTGLPAEIGDTLTMHPDVGKIGFTGSIPSARHIMSNAAQSIKGLTLELGGNDAAIVLDDAEFNSAMLSRMFGATFRMSGQVCMAIKRIYVPEKRSAEFLEKFGQVVDSIVVGDGLEPSVTMGPLHTQTARARAGDLVEDAKRRGATVRALGKVADEAVFSAGYFMRPTVVANLADDAPLMSEEQFCPAIPVATYGSVDEAIARANNTAFGLSGSVWGGDTEKAVAVARMIEAGQVWVNTHGPQAINHLAPYGGVKQSGIGRKSGIEGILEYLQSQTITTHENA